MSYPGVILRPLLPDEFSIFFDAAKPIPLGTLATFFGKLERTVRQMEGMDGLIVELSDFALGSAEPRFRIVGPGRLALEDAVRLHQEGIEKNRPDVWQKVMVGATVVSAAAAVAAAAIAAGNLNPATYRIVNHHEVNNIFVRAPDEAPHHIRRRDVLEGRDRRLGNQRKRVKDEIYLERESLLLAMSERGQVTVAGWLARDANGQSSFETMRGNTFAVSHVERGVPNEGPMVITGQIYDNRGAIYIDIAKFIAPLDDM